jgi:monoamine oxidase
LADVDVVIVGGGAAGVGAARRLAQTGLASILLEADSRLGGRAWSHEAAGIRVDLGCGWLHSADRNPWIGIAEGAGIPIDRRAAQWGVQYRDLGFSKNEQFEARQAFAAWMQRLEISPPASDCGADALIPGCEWNAYIRTIVGFISGARLEQLSIADYLAYDESSTENNWRVPSGFGALVAGSFPSNVALRLSTAVEAIALDAGGVTVRTSAGKLRARALVLTVSSAVLAGDTLELPAAIAPWRDAASLLPLGRDEKIFLAIAGDAPFADESQVLGNPRDPRAGSYYIRPLGAPVIECFFGGEGARFIEEVGAAGGCAHAVNQLCDLFGSDVRRALRPLACSGWGRMERIGGAYSYALPGHASARNSLAQPFDDRLFFAGEATSTRDFSTAHGAYDTGVRAASEAIAALAHRA